MKSDWFVSPQALSRARLDQLLSQEQLAKKAGVSVRSIRGYEREEQVIKIETLQYLAKALSREARDLGSIRVNPRTGSAPPAPPPSSPPVVPANSALPPRTTLETLVDLERASGTFAGTVESARGIVETLTAKRMQDVFTAYGLHDGARFCLSGKVDGMRGLPPAEAALIGGRNGVAARFHILKEVAPGRPFGVTIHAATAEHTAQLQKHYSAGEVSVFVRVFVVPGEPRDDGPGFSSFITKSSGKRPWTFLVEEVAESVGEAKAGAKKKTKTGATR